MQLPFMSMDDATMFLFYSWYQQNPNSAWQSFSIKFIKSLGEGNNGCNAKGPTKGGKTIIQVLGETKRCEENSKQVIKVEKTRLCNKKMFLMEKAIKNLVLGQQRWVMGSVQRGRCHQGKKQD